MTCDRCKFEIGYNEAYVTFPPAWAERDCRHEHLVCHLRHKAIKEHAALIADQGERRER